MRHLYIHYSSVLLASLCLISCGGIDRQKHDLAFHASHIWSFTSASDITNRFSDRSASFQLVVQGTSQFLVVSEQFKSTAIVDSLVYERFAANLWHLRGIVSGVVDTCSISTGDGRTEGTNRFWLRSVTGSKSLAKLQELGCV